MSVDSAPLNTKKIKIMPRSVNAVASRTRRKKIIKLAKGYLEEEKMYGRFQKMPLKKDYYTPTKVVNRKREISGLFGFKELMRLRVNME